MKHMIMLEFIKTRLKSGMIKDSEERVHSRGSSPTVQL